MKANIELAEKALIITTSKHLIWVGWYSFSRNDMFIPSIHYRRRRMSKADEASLKAKAMKIRIEKILSREMYRCMSQIDFIAWYEAEFDAAAYEIFGCSYGDSLGKW